MATNTLRERKSAVSASESEDGATIYHSPVKEPSTTMRKVVAEPCALATGRAAVLLQIASKPVGKGVAAYSGFTKDPVRRARRTVQYIYVMTFGTPEERRVVTDATHKSHSYVKSRAYDADDVDEQLWVAATIYWSLALGYEEVFGTMDDKTADLMYKESSVMATGLRVPPERWPKDRKAFQLYWDERMTRLEVTPAAREVAHHVMYPAGHWPWPYKPIFALTSWITRAHTIEYLPEHVRNAFGFPSTRFSRVTHAFFLKLNRIVYPLTVSPVRHWLKNYYMRQFRYRVGQNLPL